MARKTNRGLAKALPNVGPEAHAGRSERLTTPKPNNPEALERGIAHATEALGSAESAMQWLRTPNRVLDGRVPYEMLRGGNKDDVERVHGELYAIEHGMFA